MKLTDLNPRWAMDADIVIGDHVIHDESRTGMAISFDCPHCVARAAATGGRKLGDHSIQRLCVFFRNPIDGKVPSDDYKNLWQREGESFETLTLTPSIDASEHGHWHGFITNGDAT